MNATGSVGREPVRVSLALVSGDKDRAYLFAISAPTGFIAEFSR